MAVGRIQASRRCAGPIGLCWQSFRLRLHTVGPEDELQEAREPVATLRRRFRCTLIV